MVSVSRLEVVFSESNVCFGRLVLVPGDGGLVAGMRSSVGSCMFCCFLCCLEVRWCFRISSRGVCCGCR